jgi:hypothetical protein
MLQGKEIGRPLKEHAKSLCSKNNIYNVCKISIVLQAIFWKINNTLFEIGGYKLGNQKCFS